MALLAEELGNTVALAVAAAVVGLRSAAMLADVKLMQISATISCRHRWAGVKKRMNGSGKVASPERKCFGPDCPRKPRGLPLGEVIDQRTK